MKIRLIQAAQLDTEGNPIKFKKVFLPNLTLPTLAGITPAGVDVAIIIEYVQDIDFDEAVDLVAITAQTGQAPRAYQLADEFRKRGTRTIMGGTHASICSEEALQHFDSVLIGEAEDIWAKIIKDAEQGRLQRIYQAETRPDLSTLIIPRFDLLDYNHYVIPPFAKTPLIPIQTSRGCPNSCDFCSVSGFFGRKMRHKPVEHVIKEIETIQPSRVFFTDDNIGANPRYAKELFRALKPLKLRWACQMSTRIMQDPDLIELAGEAGCHETFMGIESLNAANLKSLSKSFNKTAEYADLFKRLKDAGILVQASMIFGLDHDTVDSLRRTVETLMTWDINYLYMSILTPLPGTKLHERMQEAGTIKYKDWTLYDVTKVVIEHRTMTEEELYGIVWDMYKKFYSRTNIFKRAWRFRKEYICNFPRDNMVEEVFFQLHMRDSVHKGLHPFSLGLQVKTP